MNLRPSLYIARRYVFARRSLHFITIITTISLVGIAVGIAALICVTSIFNGFREVVESMMVRFDPHIRITAAQGSVIRNYDSLLSSLSRNTGIATVSPVLQGRTLALRGSSPQIFQLNAVQPGRVDAASGIRHAVVYGRFDLGPGRIILGSGLADRLRALPGDTLTLLSPRAIEESLTGFAMPKGVRVTVSGIFQSNAKEYDDYHAYTSAELGARLLKFPEGAASSLDIRLHDIGAVETFSTELKKNIPAGLMVETWYDLHRELYDIMQLERIGSFIVLSVVVLVAVFNILASLSMTVIEKRADIAILKSIGATDDFIKKIFLAEGIFIGCVGTVAGVILGLGLCQAQIRFGIFRLDTSKYLLSALPVSIHASDVIIASLMSLILSFLATLYPARRAARTNVVEALRSE